jgi:hypothetical protein
VNAENCHARCLNSCLLFVRDSKFEVFFRFRLSKIVMQRKWTVDALSLILVLMLYRNLTWLCNDSREKTTSVRSNCFKTVGHWLLVERPVSFQFGTWLR